MMEQTSLDATDRAILNALQEGFPLTPRPFATAAVALGIVEADLIARLQALREARFITRFGPFLDAEAMGGAFCLCAMAVPPQDFDRVMTLVNAAPEVAHNYERQHRLNMWFVLACETPQAIAATADRLQEQTGLPVLRFAKEREYFIGFRVKA